MRAAISAVSYMGARDAAMVSHGEDILGAMLLGLGPLYRERVQYDLEMACCYLPLIQCDGLRIVAALLKKPSWIRVFVKLLSERPEACYDVEACLEVLMEMVRDRSGKVEPEESRNLDGQGVARFLGFAFLYRIRLIEKHAQGVLVLGSSRVRCRFVHDKSFCLKRLGEYMALEFCLLGSDTYLAAHEKMVAASWGSLGSSPIQTSMMVVGFVSAGGRHGVWRSGGAGKGGEGGAGGCR